MNRAEAADVLEMVQRKTGKSLTMRAIAKPKAVNTQLLDAEQAMRLIEGEMVASLTRCAELEGKP